jgi:hypothetical protein
MYLRRKYVGGIEDSVGFAKVAINRLENLEN